MLTINFKLRKKNKIRGLKLQHKWITEFNWLSYSEIIGGAFCKHCVLFANTGGIGNQPLKQLVNEIFYSWKKAKVVNITIVTNLLIFVVKIKMFNRNTLKKLWTD